MARMESEYVFREDAEEAIAELVDGIAENDLNALQTIQKYVKQNGEEFDIEIPDGEGTAFLDTQQSEALQMATFLNGARPTDSLASVISDTVQGNVTLTRNNPSVLDDYAAERTGLPQALQTLRDHGVE